jgi:hypothetical protein
LPALVLLHMPAIETGLNGLGKVVQIASAGC